MPKYSIIIPTLNEEKYIGILLGSLANQTFSDFEVIVVDGGSKDKTLKEIQKYTTTLKLKAITADHKGTSHQRNIGASISSASHLVFMDADTWIETGFLSDFDKQLSKKPSDIATVYNKPLSKSFIDVVLYWIFNNLYLYPMQYITPGAVGTFIYSQKQAFKKIGGFSEDISYAEDFDYCRTAHNQKLSYKLFSRPPVFTSVRRFQKEGRFKFILKEIYSGIYYHLFGSFKTGNPLQPIHDTETH